jgi:uncharacterized protein with HEPN domain
MPDCYMRHETLYLEDIRDAADSITRFIAGFDGEATLRESDVVSSAVVHKLAVIGEASARLSAELKARHPEIAWAEIVAFRNILVHAYFGIDWSVVWLAASTEVPALRMQVAAILETEFGGAGAESSMVD